MENAAKSHNVIVFHCLACGRLEHVGLKNDPPQCCGHAMTEACEYTVYGGNAYGERRAEALPRNPAEARPAANPRSRSER